MDILVVLVLALIGSNVITLVFLVFDRFIFLEQKSAKLADELYMRTAQQFERRIDKIVQHLTDETQHQLDMNSAHYLDVTERLKDKVFAAYETDAASYKTATAELIQKLNSITEEVTQDLLDYLHTSQQSLSKSQQLYLSQLENSSKEMFEHEKFSIKEYVGEEKKRAGAFISQLVMEKVQAVTSEVLHVTLNTQDHERAVREALKNYHFEE
jgi:MFS superfamily sulfate permease-like transporter